ncbi:MAG: hypothetical protein M3464_09700 [Chloroflexota bacterium]|nr:hypothetical protein [Chloroflexota bacterium]
MDQEAPAAPAAAQAAATAARRLIESATIAVVTSTGLYLIGAVYTDAYYGRMSIEVTSLDLSPPYLALQSAHVLPGLLEYPWTLLFLYALYRVFARPIRWLHARYEHAWPRFDRGVLLVINLIIVAPLVLDAILFFGDSLTLAGNAIVTEISSLLGTVVMFLAVYAIWLSLGPRVSIIAEIRRRQVLPIALLFAAYLLNALVSTADTGQRAAELFMMGIADTSITVTFVPEAGSTLPLPATELLLVTARGGTYFVVERQGLPPDLRPAAYMIPVDGVELAQLRRSVAADLELDEATLEELSTDDSLREPSPVAEDASAP